MKIEKVNITDLIPQRAPMVMLSNLLKFTDNSATTCLNIKDDNIFCTNGLFHECGLIENIAQTAAAMNGYATLMKNEKVKLGYIGAVKNLRIYKLPEVNSTIKTTVSLQNKVMNVDIIKGIIMQEDSVIAECEMKIFLEETKKE